MGVTVFLTPHHHMATLVFHEQPPRLPKDERTNIVVYASSCSPGLISFQQLETYLSHCASFKEITGLPNMRESVYWSCIYLLACDKWDNDVIGVVHTTPSCYVIPYAVDILKRLAARDFSLDYEDAIPIPCKWDTTIGTEDSQAKLLYQSLLHLKFDEPVELRYYGSGMGDTYATSVLRGYCDKEKIEYEFFDPQAIQDIGSAPFYGKDNSLVDVYDDYFVNEHLKHNTSGMIKSTAPGGSLDNVVKHKVIWIPVRKPFHPERVYMNEQKFLRYAIELLLVQETMMLCTCFSCRCLSMLSAYFVDPYWFMSVFNTPNHHHSTHKWKLPALTKFIDEEHSAHSKVSSFVERAGISAFSRNDEAKSYVKGVVVDFFPGDSPYPGALKFFSNDSFPPVGTTIKASMAMHHDPSLFLYSSLYYERVIIQDELKAAPGRFWDHCSYHVPQSTLRKFYVNNGYSIVIDFTEANRYTLVLQRKVPILLSPEKRAMLKSLGRHMTIKSLPKIDVNSFPIKSKFDELPLWIQPVQTAIRSAEGIILVDGYNFEFDGKKFVKHGNNVMTRELQVNNLVNFNLSFDVIDNF